MLLNTPFTLGGRLYRRDARGDLYVWTPSPIAGLGGLDGWWSKITSPVRKVFRAVTKTTIGRTALKVAGVVAAPFTGGLSLAAAAAASQYGKVRYQQGGSRKSAWRGAVQRGVVGAAVGYGISSAYAAWSPGMVSGAAPAGAPAGATGFYAGGTPGVVGAASPVSTGFYSGYTGAVAAAPATVAPGVSFLPSFGNVISYAGTALKTAGTFLPILAQTGLLGPKGGERQVFDPGMTAPSSGYEGYGYGGQDAGGGGFAPSGGGPNMPPEGAPGDEMTPGPLKVSPAVLGIGAAIAGLLLFTTMKGKRK